eukprot:IDg17641t1
MAPTTAPPKKEGAATAAVMETLVRGTIRVEDLTKVIYLIRALCPEVGQLGEFREHDRSYSSSPEVRGVPKNSIRLRRRILQAGPSDARHANLDHVLLTYGLPDRRVSAPVERRPLSSVAMGHNAPELLSLLGCTMQYEYVRSGLRFRTRSGFTVEVYVIKKLQQAALLIRIVCLLLCIVLNLSSCCVLGASAVSSPCLCPTPSLFQFALACIWRPVCNRGSLCAVALIISYTFTYGPANCCLGLLTFKSRRRICHELIASFIVGYARRCAMVPRVVSLSRRRAPPPQRRARFNYIISRTAFLALASLLAILYYSRSPCRRHVRLAFSIQASSSTASRIPRLMQAVWDKCNIYAIHFDSKIPFIERTKLSNSLLMRYPQNVLIVRSRPVSYAGITMLLAT